MRTIILAGLLAGCGYHDWREVDCFDGCTAAKSDSAVESTPGPAGSQGAAGTAGMACSVRQLPYGAQIDCADGTSAVVLNGTSGAAGSNGAPGQDGTAGSSAPPGTSCTMSRIDKNYVRWACDDGSEIIIKG